MSNGQEAVTKWKMAHNPLMNAVGQFDAEPDEKKVAPAPRQLEDMLERYADEAVKRTEAGNRAAQENAVQHSGVLATGTRSTHDKLPPVYTDQVSDFQDLLAQGDSKEAKALKAALDSQKGGHGSWGPKTQAAFEAACEAAGVDPKSVDFTKPDNQALEALKTHINPSHNKGTGLSEELEGKGKIGLDYLTAAQTQELQNNMVAAGFLTQEQANGKWGEEQLNGVSAMLDKNNASPEAHTINSNNKTITFEEFVNNPTGINKGPLSFVEYTETYLEQVNNFAKGEAHQKSKEPQVETDLLTGHKPWLRGHAEDILIGDDKGYRTPPIADPRDQQKPDILLGDEKIFSTPPIVDPREQQSKPRDAIPDPMNLGDAIPKELLASLKEAGVSGGAEVRENGNPPGGGKSAARGIA